MIKIVQTYITIDYTKRIPISKFVECNADERAFYTKYGGGWIIFRLDKQNLVLKLTGLSHTFNDILLRAIEPVCKGEAFKKDFFEKTGYGIAFEPIDDQVDIYEYRIDNKLAASENCIQRGRFPKKELVVSMYEAVKEFDDFQSKYFGVNYEFMRTHFSSAELAMLSIGINIS